jgi:ubiquinone/menaquinone biosynthesis C-methylase UbiE
MRQKKAKKILDKLKLTYDIIAEDFDRTRHKPVEEMHIYQAFIKPNSILLDLGCGNGRLFDSLKEKLHYIGIDNNEKLLEIAKNRHPHAVFKKGDLLDIPVENETVDTVLCLRAFHHLPSAGMRLHSLEEIKRSLKLNGTVIISVWNLWQKKYAFHLLKAFFRFVITFGSYAFNDTFIPWGKICKRYYHAFTPMELTKLIKKAGFELEEVTYIKNGNRVPFKQSHDIVIIAKKVKFYED